MVNKKKTIVLIATVIILIASYTWHQSTKRYGNDKESIIKVIKSVEGYEDKDIQLIQIKDFGELRYVGFLADRMPSYIQFRRNGKGNYEWKHLESNQNESFAMFSPSLPNFRKIMFVTNAQNEIAKMTVDINGETEVQTFPPKEPSVEWLDLPESDDDGYSYRNYRYYDEDGALIAEYE
ncbi:hypothetical protein LCM10_03955 [Rossellomorea aquimaris]|uniref:hypothetical protein n=1 Tax=Rossellomorea aquimaris TaxID=189382 RepID=UPI001CD67597|nr:hypothetical protein [Rossellomorea aquimaris]MCA1054130.1 hypothetical protein [Rossellomorea aquimaris]